ncbi:MAG: hypothetical protein P4K98_06680 [Bryobacteraceae bacterium]|nr:hypothetical protein [Bryobacteraceae bacterium]
MPLARIFSSYRLLEEKATELERVAEELGLQKLSLETERNGLQTQLRRLEKEIAEFKQREVKLKDDARQSIALQFERDELRLLYDKQKAEMGTLQNDLRETRGEAELQRERLWAPPGHVYSPITDPNDPFVRQTEIQDLAALNDRPDLPLDEPAQLRLLGWLGEHGSRFPFQSGPAPEWRYHTGNGHFGHADAALMFSMLLEYKPSHLIEIGCGFSSLLVMDVNDRFLDHSLEATFFDPRPDAILALLTPMDAYRERVQTRRSQDVDCSVFSQLGRGDILSLETSHVAKTGSDVCDILFRILPSLAPGVLVHIHDIYYPFEYPEAWVVQDNRSWNGAYLLRAFLQFNSNFRVLFFNDLMARKYPEQMSAAFPGMEDTQASSIWIEKIG